MIPKETKFYSIVHRTCPRCHEGPFFVSHPYDLKHAGELHKKCPVCDLRYEKEPGFFWGALFVSYAQTIAFSLLVFGAVWQLLPDLRYLWMASIVVGATVIAAPYLYALSKIIWANLFFHFDPNAVRRT